MRIGIVADIHGNWTALQQVIGRMEELGVDMVFGLGDYLWTTTGDEQVVAWIKESAACGCFVRGNGDTMEYYERHRHLAHSDPRAIYEYLSGLPERVVLTLGGYRILLQHEWWPGGKFTGSALFTHLTQPPYVSPEVNLTGIDIAIFGDCHLPLHHATRDALLVHPGSVGAPFDTDPAKAKFASLDLGPHGVRLEHHAVPFDIHAANREILLGRRVDIGHSYDRKMTEARLKVTAPYTAFWQPVPPPVCWSKKTDEAAASQ